MTPERWTFRKLPAVEEFIQSQQRVVRSQIERDIIKLTTRGTKATAPLVGRLAEDVYYLRVKAEPHGIFRIFYYQAAERTFEAFFPYAKKSQKLPGRVKRHVLKLRKELKGGRG